jgi:glycosyltransferase involved in cell wall biosynthesis
VHNGADTLERSLESLKQQTVREFNIIAINDASTDTTGEILRKWQIIIGADRFRIITNPENLGLTHSLNLGLEIIHTVFTARIDADDWWESTKLESQLARLHDRDEIGVLGCNYENHRDSRKTVSHLPLTDATIRSGIIRRNPFAHSCVIFRTALIKKLGGYDAGTRYGQDYELWLRLLPHTRFANLETVLCHRSVERGISATRQREQMRQGMKTQVRYIRKYHWPLYFYLYLTELFILSLIPDPVRKLKQRFIP